MSDTKEGFPLGLPMDRRTWLAAAGGTLYAGLGARQGRAAGAVGSLVEAPPRPLPEGLGFTDADGQPRAMKDFLGQGVVLNLWATWCAPCVVEMPALDRAQGLLAEAGITILALSSDRGGRGVVEPFFRERRITRLGLWLDPRGAAGRALGARGLPTTVVIDRSGMERARLEGSAAWDAPEMLVRLRRLAMPAVG